MKKVLLVLGLALCGTFAFAQTAKTVAPDKLSRDDVKLAPVQLHHQTAGEAQVDYKASIFTKAITVVDSFQFDAAHMTGISYGSTAVVGSNEPTVIGGAHTMASEKSYWFRVNNASYLSTTDFTQVYPLGRQYFASERAETYMSANYGDGQDNGFMMISSIDASGIVTGTVPDRLNAYFQLPTVTLPSSCVMPTVRYFQYYRKFYDNCYLDYKINNVWNTVEINVTGVDVDVNGSCLGYYETILPHAVATQGTIDIRFRQFSEGSSQIAGYGWAVDDVQILASDATSDWAFQNYGYLDGFYGLIPEGFNLPIGYTVKARNTAITNINNVTLSVEHRYWDDGEWADNDDFELSRTQQNHLTNNVLPAGDIYKKYVLSINERGFMYDTLGLSAEWVTVGDVNQPEAYFHCAAEYYDTNVYGVSDPSALPSTYQYVGLPTDHQGKNQFIIRATGSSLDTVLDRMTYTVSGNIDTTEANKRRGLTVPGYRWGHDNGVIPTGSEFAYQFTNDGYVSDDPDGGDQYYAGYEVYTRFNTPSEVPTDANGNPYVIRGVELIPTSRLSAEAMNNALITPVAYFDYDFGEGDGMNTYYFNNYTGLSTHHTQVVDGSWFDSRDTLHYKLPSQNYNAVNILFPGQPTLFPNMSLYFGYNYAGGTGVFSVGTPQTYYRETSDSNTRYRDNPALADYANQFYPTNKVVDVIAYDALNSSSSDRHSINCYNITEYPMIRLIVGPAMVLPEVVVEAECNEDDADTVNRYWIARGGNSMCIYGNDTVAEGSSIGYNVYPGDPEENEEGDWVYDNHNVIEHIWVSHNGGEWVEYAIDGTNDMVEAHEYDVIEPDSSWWDPMLVRSYYTVYLENMTGEYTIKAQAGWRPLGVSTPVETQVNLGLAPNPATSQVRVNVTGVTGKVNCNILDMSGRVIYSADFDAESEQFINLNGVPAGAYFVRVTGDTFSKVERLIVR